VLTDFEPRFASALLKQVNAFKTPRARRKFLACLGFCDSHFSRKVGEWNGELGGSLYYKENTQGNFHHEYASLQ